VDVVFMFMTCECFGSRSRSQSDPKYKSEGRTANTSHSQTKLDFYGKNRSGSILEELVDETDGTKIYSKSCSQSKHEHSTSKSRSLRRPKSNKSVSKARTWRL